MNDPTVIMICALAIPVLAFGLLIWAYIVTRRKLQRPYCPDCGADLPSFDLERCPECGNLLADSEDDDEDEPFENDVPADGRD